MFLMFLNYNACNVAHNLIITIKNQYKKKSKYDKIRLPYHMYYSSFYGWGLRMILIFILF